MSKFTITPEDIHNLSPDQLADIEIRATKRYHRMRPIGAVLGDITLAVAAILAEIIDTIYPGNEARVLIIAQDDVKAIMRAYICRWKLTQFPYRGGHILDYLGYADFSKVMACFG